MFDSVLVPLDGTREAEAAIPCAVEEARRHDCPLVLIRVVPRPETAEARVPHGGPARWRQPWSLAETRAAQEAALAYLRQVMLRHHLPRDTEFVAPVGDPVSRVEQEIERRSRPLVVLAGETSTGSPEMGAGEPRRRLLLSGTASVLRIGGSRVTAMSDPAPAMDHSAIVPAGAVDSAAACG